MRERERGQWRSASVGRLEKGEEREKSETEATLSVIKGYFKWSLSSPWLFQLEQ